MEWGPKRGKAAAKPLGGPQSVAAPVPPRQYDRSIEERPHRADKDERVEPTGLTAGARGQQHEPVGAHLYCALGVTDAGDIREHQRACVMQRREHRRRRADAGNDNLGPVPQQHLQILLKPRVGPVQDQVRTDRSRRPSALVAMTAQPVFDLAKPAIELFRAAAIHGRECADHAVAAGGHYKVNAGDEEHRRRDQRQAEAVAKSREWTAAGRTFAKRSHVLRVSIVVRGDTDGSGRWPARDGLRIEPSRHERVRMLCGGRLARKGSAPAAEWRPLDRTGEIGPKGAKAASNSPSM